MDPVDRTAEFEAFGSVIRLADATGGRHSALLQLDLFLGATERGDINPAKIIREIRALEGIGTASQTKPPTQFTRKPLRGLWHKHYSGAGVQAIAHNVKGALKTYGIPLFQKKIDEAQAAGEERYMTSADVEDIVQDIVYGNMERRTTAAAVTGDWLIYAQHQGQNFYLCLADHTTGDDVIRSRIDEVCVKEFPFLLEILN